MRLIDADALEELFREVIGSIAKKPEMNGNLEHMVRASAMVIEMIKDAPTIEPEPRKGKWIHGRVLSRSFYRGNKIDFEYEDWRCSVCGYIADPIEVQKYKFCPGCGFPMVMEKGEEDDNSNLVNSNL